VKFGAAQEPEHETVGPIHSQGWIQCLAIENSMTDDWCRAMDEKRLHLQGLPQFGVQSVSPLSEVLVS
jgi:hypothetical protein